MDTQASDYIPGMTESVNVKLFNIWFHTYLEYFVNVINGIF